MVYLKGMEIGILILAFVTGIGIISSHSPSLYLPSEKTVINWSSSKLEPKDLLDKLDQKQCFKNKREYLACVAAVDKMGYALGVNINPKKLKLSRNRDDYLIQKDHFEPWLKIYTTQKVDFQKITNELIYQKLDPKYHKWITAVGINGWFSIKYDPHSYLKPLLVEDEDDEDLMVPIDSIPLKEPIPPLSLDEFPEISPEPQLDVVPKISEPTPVVFKKKYPKLVTVSLSKKKDLPSMITLVNFDENSCHQFQEALKTVVRAKSEKLIIDLKENPGGLVSEVVCIASTLVGQKIIVKLKPFKGLPEVLRGPLPQIYFGEVQVFIDDQSASASEILAGSLQFYKRATIIGDTSFGKGTYQDIDYTWAHKKVRFMKTQGYYFLPGGHSPQMKGINPDQKIHTKSGAREKDLYLYPLPAPKPLDPFFDF